jgi:hypothetical protein
MVIGSAVRRLNIQLWIFAVLIDVGVAAIAAYFLNRDEWLSTTFWVWLVLQAAGIVLAVLGVLRLLLLKWAGAFRPAKNGMLTTLETGNFPIPPGYIHSVDDYLSNVADNEEESIQTRLTAASVSGARQGIRSMAGWMKGAMIDSAHEEALKEYAARRIS